ncbi:hypothetical protein [Ferdinandcohnia sp. Marseille-Q9671]
MKKIGILFVGLLLVGWNGGFSKNELLEETLYTRYLSYLDQKYSDFIVCPRIEIERIEGDTRRHIVYASALNYGSHHGDLPFDRIHFTLKDTPENGVEIKDVRIEKEISEKESQTQCNNRN